MTDGIWFMDYGSSTSFDQPSTIAISHQQSAIDSSPDAYGGEVANRIREELLLVLVVGPVAGGIEGARGAVEIALQQERRRDAERGAIRRGILLERAGEQGPCEIRPVRDQRDAAGGRQVVGVGIVGHLDEQGFGVGVVAGAGGGGGGGGGGR